MNKHKKIFFLYFIIFLFFEIHPVPHVSSYPFIAPDTFRQFCKFVLDEDSAFNPEDVQQGDVLFIKAEFFDVFFSKYHPHIKHTYVLVSHDSDLSVPGKYKDYLEDEKIFVWFARNMDYYHSKLHPLPIGLANQMYEHGNISMVQKCMDTFKDKKKNKKMLYLNFWITHPERQEVIKLFHNKSYCTSQNNPHYGWNKKTPEEHLKDLTYYKFVLSPRGNGLDCHRTWEALLMGCIPIVRTSSLDSLYENLPVLIVQAWEDVTEEFLKEKYKELKDNKSYNYEKLFAPYWLNKIEKYQQLAKEIKI